MEASLKKQLTEVFRIEDSHHVVRMIRIMIHLERLRETTRHTINMNRPPIFSLSKNLKLIQVEFNFCHFILIDDRMKATEINIRKSTAEIFIE